MLVEERTVSYLSLVRQKTNPDTLKAQRKLSEHMWNGPLRTHTLILAAIEKRYYGRVLHIDLLNKWTRTHLNGLFGVEALRGMLKEIKQQKCRLGILDSERVYRKMCRMRGRSSTDNNACALFRPSDQYGEGWRKGRGGMSTSLRNCCVS